MGIKVLLADQPIVRQGLRALLEKEPDLEVVAEAANGQTAVSLVKELLPEVVIADATLPDLPGVMVTRQILAAAPGVKVIILSMYSDRRFVVNILKAGASGYVLKDCAFEELIRAIRETMAHKTYISPGVSEIVVQDYLEVLRESEIRFRAIFEGASIGIALVNRDGYIEESNPALQRMLGLNWDELYHKPFTDFLPPEDASRCLNLFKESMEGKRDSFQVAKQYLTRDGRPAWGRFTVSPVRGIGADHRFAIGMVEDITEQKQAENEIRTYQEQLRSLASELSLTEERERRRLATDLHDHIGQILALAQIKLGAMREAASSPSMAEAMDEVRRLVEQSIKYSRSLTFELSPPILYDLGFEAAVEWVAELIQNQHAIPISVQTDRQPLPMDDEIRVLLFQAVRELLVNVVKHAKAQKAEVNIGREGSLIRIQVKDDGIGLGISPGAPLTSARGFGLFSIRERLKYLGGHLEVESEPGRGTVVTLMVPLKY